MLLDCVGFLCRVLLVLPIFLHRAMSLTYIEDVLCCFCSRLFLAPLIPSLPPLVGVRTRLLEVLSSGDDGHGLLLLVFSIRRPAQSFSYSAGILSLGR